MNFRGWVAFVKLPPASLLLLLSSGSRRRLFVHATGPETNTCVVNMAEEAKKQAAYKAVDNHVQVCVCTCFFLHSDHCPRVNDLK